MSEQNTTMNLEGRWPELFEPLTPQQRRAVVQALAANWHEGWQPNYQDVRDLVDFTTGAITGDEYDRRSLARVGLTAQRAG